MCSEKFKELNKAKNYIYNCKKCGLCAGKVSEKLPFVCPVKEFSPGFEHFSSRGKIIIAEGLLNAEIKASAGLAEAAYSCTMCGNCMNQCQAMESESGGRLVDSQKIVQAMRCDLYTLHPELVSNQIHTAIKATRQYDSPWGLPRTVKQKWAKDLVLKDASKDACQYLLFSGCTMPSTPLQAERLKRGSLLLNKMGFDIGILGASEPCCGSLQKRIGAADIARAMISGNISQFNKVDCESIITFCSGCYNMLKNEYHESDRELKAKVYHVVEIFSKAIKEGNLKFNEGHTRKIMYHDPCHLGRHSGGFDAPRHVLKSIPGIEVVEKRGNRENSVCCGAGGGMKMFNKGTIAGATGSALLCEAERLGVEAVVTACPFCEMNLDEASKALDLQMPVYDVIDIVFDAAV